MEYKDFSSLPPDKEQEFVVYEKTSVEAAKKAKIFAGIASLSFLVVVMAIVFSFDPPKNKMAEDDLSALAAPKKPKKDAEKPAEEAPKPEATAPAGEGAAPAAGATEDKAAGGEGAAAGADKPAGE